MPNGNKRERAGADKNREAAMELLRRHGPAVYPLPSEGLAHLSLRVGEGKIAYSTLASMLRRKMVKRYREDGRLWVRITE